MSLMIFWQTLPKPIIGMSPMDGYTDASFRELVCSIAKPAVVFTEFINYQMVFHKKLKFIPELLYHKTEQPIVAQIFGNDPDDIYLFAQIICELGFDGLDLNMGCPARHVASSGSGAGLIRTPDLARKLIKAAKQGIDDWVNGRGNEFPQKILAKIENTKSLMKTWGVEFSSGNAGQASRTAIPVSVKTRLGYDSVIVEEWIETLLAENPDCITMHGRTFKQGYSGVADWDAIARGRSVIDSYGASKDKPVYLGNGDIKSLKMAKEYAGKYQLDGVLVGRAILGLPGFFKGQESIDSMDEAKKVMLEHSRLKWEYNPQAYYEIRKHLMWYIKGFENAAQIRQKVAQVNSHSELAKILSNIPD